MRISISGITALLIEFIYLIGKLACQKVFMTSTNHRYENDKKNEVNFETLRNKVETMPFGWFVLVFRIRFGLNDHVSHPRLILAFNDASYPIVFSKISNNHVRKLKTHSPERRKNNFV